MAMAMAMSTLDCGAPMGGIKGIKAIVDEGAAAHSFPPRYIHPVHERPVLSEVCRDVDLPIIDISPLSTSPPSSLPCLSRRWSKSKSSPESAKHAQNGASFSEGAELDENLDGSFRLQCLLRMPYRNTEVLNDCGGNALRTAGSESWSSSVGYGSTVECFGELFRTASGAEDAILLRGSLEGSKLRDKLHSVERNFSELER